MDAEFHYGFFDHVNIGIVGFVGIFVIEGFLKVTVFVLDEIFYTGEKRYGEILLRGDVVFFDEGFELVFEVDATETIEAG